MRGTSGNKSTGARHQLNESPNGAVARSMFPSSLDRTVLQVSHEPLTQGGRGNCFKTMLANGVSLCKHVPRDEQAWKKTCV